MWNLAICTLSRPSSPGSSFLVTTMDVQAEFHKILLRHPCIPPKLGLWASLFPRLRWYQLLGLVREGSLFGTELTQFLDVYNQSAPRTRTDGAYAKGQRARTPEGRRGFKISFLMLDESLSYWCPYRLAP